MMHRSPGAREALGGNSNIFPEVNTSKR
jgi:hypothetical protein